MTKQLSPVAEEYITQLNNLHGDETVEECLETRSNFIIWAATQIGHTLGACLTMCIRLAYAGLNMPWEKEEDNVPE